MKGFVEIVSYMKISGKKSVVTVTKHHVRKLSHLQYHVSHIKNSIQ